MRRASMDAAYFEGLYAQGDGDPWEFATSDYEKRKYAATLAALTRKKYLRALEVGCSIGILTHMLATRCDTLTATEPVARALEKAQTRCAADTNVRFEQGSAPDDWPDGAYDLIVLSEVVYYLTAADVGQLAARVATSLQPGGQVLLVHWIRETDYPLSGDEAVSLCLAKSPQLRVIRQERTADYRLDLAEAPSVSSEAA